MSDSLEGLMELGMFENDKVIDERDVQVSSDGDGGGDVQVSSDGDGGDDVQVSSDGDGGADVVVLDGPTAPAADEDVPETVAVIPAVCVGSYLAMTVKSSAQNGLQDSVQVAVRVTKICDDNTVEAVAPLYTLAQPLLEDGALPVRLNFMTEKAGGWLLFDSQTAAQACDTTGFVRSDCRYSKQKTATAAATFNEEMRHAAAQRMAAHTFARTDGHQSQPTAEYRDHPDVLQVVHSRTGPSGFNIRCNVCWRRYQGGKGGKGSDRRYQSRGEGSGLRRFKSQHCVTVAHVTHMDEWFGYPDDASADTSYLTDLENNRRAIDAVTRDLKVPHPKIFESLKIDRIQGTLSCTLPNSGMKFIQADTRVSAGTLTYRIKTHYEARLKEAARKEESKRKAQLKSTRSQQASADASAQRPARSTAAGTGAGLQDTTLDASSSDDAVVVVDPPAGEVTIRGPPPVGRTCPTLTSFFKGAQKDPSRGLVTQLMGTDRHAATPLV
jgi:hypothetical protein